MSARSLEEQLVNALRLWPPDFLLAEELLARGADVNAVMENEDENVLSAVILGYPEGRFELSELEEDGRYLPDIYIPDGGDTDNCREMIVISLDDGSTPQVNYKNTQAYLTQVPEVG